MNRPDGSMLNPRGCFSGGTAEVIYAALYGKSPAGLKYNGGLDEKTAAFLQEVAWDTVSEYYGK